MKKFFILSATVLLVLLLASSCFIFLEDDLEDEDSYIDIYNDSFETIFYVYITPADEAWGEDWLGTSLLFSGDSRSFLVDPGTYDVMVEEVDFQNDYGIAWDVEVYEGTTTYLTYDGTYLYED